MSDYVESLQRELAYLEQTRNPRAAGVRDALAAAGYPVPDPAPERERRPRRETAVDKTPKERASA